MTWGHVIDAGQAHRVGLGIGLERAELGVPYGRQFRLTIKEVQHGAAHAAYGWNR
jgi:hypothetical protein